MSGIDFSDDDEEEEEERKKKQWWRSKKFIFLVILLLGLLVVWAVLRPKKPRFVLVEAIVYGLNVSAPNLLTSTFQVTVRSSNPNGHAGVYFDHLVVYASFNEQQITFPTPIPPTYQDKNEENLWSLFLYGVSIPIATSTATTLKQDQSAWNLSIIFKIDGSVRWKVLAFTTKTYHIHVKCRANIPVGNPTVGVAISNNAVKYQLFQTCTASV